jgi:ATP/maltotriose-dependent transcriptional regulator MalT
MEAIMSGLSEIIQRRSTPGILIVDLENTLHYCNNEALDMIPDLQIASREEKGGKIPIPSEIADLCNALKKQEQDGAEGQGTESSSAVLESDLHPPYSMRAFYIGKHERDKPTHIMVLVEKIAERHDVDFEKVRKEFKLSARELEVLKLICEGLGNKQISQRLFISEYTAKDHIKKIMKKMEVASRSQIITTLK